MAWIQELRRRSDDQAALTKPNPFISLFEEVRALMTSAGYVLDLLVPEMVEFNML